MKVGTLPNALASVFSSGILKSAVDSEEKVV